MPDFELAIDDLARVPESELLERRMTALAKVAVWLLRAVRVGFDENVLERLAALLEEARAAAPPEAFLQVFVYLSDVEGGEAIYDAIDAVGSDELREVAMGLRNTWLEEGRQEGRELGRHEGLVAGRAETLLKLLRLRFGSVPEEVRQRVLLASLDELDRWTEQVLTARSLHEVLR